MDGAAESGKVVFGAKSSRSLGGTGPLGGATVWRICSGRFWFERNRHNH